MRLTRLDLTRYGRFTDLSLPFEAPEPGGPDLHVIYGPNEAGKSTLLEGWLDLLFQIPLRSDMDFLHPYASMQIGAALDIDGRSHEVTRVKKRDHSLLDAHGNPMGEALLHAGLRGLDRASYAAMFCLNRDTLDQGGESILASQGDLGELLFQASAGLSDLAAQLDAIDAESQDFLNSTGRKGRLRDLKKEADALTARIKELDTAAAEFARLSKTRDDARAAWQDARKRAEDAQAGVVETERLAAALPLAVKLHRLDARIAEFGDLPDPPAGWLDELPALDRAETELNTRLDTARSTVASLEAEHKGLTTDPAILEARAEIDAAEALKSAHDTARADLPKRREDRERFTGIIRASLDRLGQPGADPDTLLPDAATLARLRALVERHSGIETACRTAAAELDQARAHAGATARRLSEAGGGGTDLGGLAGLVKSLRHADPAGTLDRAETRLAEAETTLRAAMTALAPWSGDTDALAALTPPDRAVLDRLGGEIDSARREADRARDRLGELEDALRQAEARHAAPDTGAAVTLEDAAQARARREAEWTAHRVALTAETADRFEAAMRLDDKISERLSELHSRAEKAAEAERNLTEARRAVDTARTRLAEAEEGCAALSARLAGIVTALSPALPADMALSDVLSWLTRLDTARTALADRDAAAADLARRRTAVDQARTDLAAALAQAGQPLPDTAGLPLALETAQALLDRAAEIAALRRADQEAQAELARRKEAQEQAEAARAAWCADWAEACANTWMADAPPEVAEMRAILDELDTLRQAHRDARQLDHRITTMEANRDRFAAAVTALARRLDLPPEQSAPALWGLLTDRLRQAEAQEDRRRNLETRLTKARATLAETEAQAALHRERTDAFARHFGTGTWDDTRAALTRAGQLAQLRQDRRDLADDLCARLHCDTLPAALARLDGLDSDTLTARAETLRRELDLLTTAREEAHTAYRQTEAALDRIGGDGAVARLQEQRQTLLLEIEEGARRHLRRRLGQLAVTAALRRYRDTHRSGMLDRASEAFRRMSQDRYTGLATHPDGQRETLVALAAEGGSKQADQLSDGTRAQLYLALRIAGYHEFVRNSGPVPFIADDIMESFDDARAEAAFALLGEMSRSGQVIYLTHHAHIRDIARRACPGVRIHELPD